MKKLAALVMFACLFCACSAFAAIDADALKDKAIDTAKEKATEYVKEKATEAVQEKVTESVSENPTDALKLLKK